MYLFWRTGDETHRLLSYSVRCWLQTFAAPRLKSRSIILVRVGSLTTTIARLMCPLRTPSARRVANFVIISTRTSIPPLQSQFNFFACRGQWVMRSYPEFLSSLLSQIWTGRSETKQVRKLIYNKKNTIDHHYWLAIMTHFMLWWHVLGLIWFVLALYFNGAECIVSSHNHTSVVGVK